jgi:hypothetical protein
LNTAARRRQAKWDGGAGFRAEVQASRLWNAEAGGTPAPRQEAPPQLGSCFGVRRFNAALVCLLFQCNPQDKSGDESPHSKKGAKRPSPISAE